MKKILIIVGVIMVAIVGVVFYQFAVSPSALENNPPLNDQSVQMSNYFVQDEAEIGVEYPQYYPVVYLINNNEKVLIYKGQKATGLTILTTSEYPYLVLEYGCSGCDGPREGSMILNVQTKKTTTLPGKDVLSFDLSQIWYM